MQGPHLFVLLPHVVGLRVDDILCSWDCWALLGVLYAVQVLLGGSHLLCCRQNIASAQLLLLLLLVSAWEAANTLLVRLISPLLLQALQRSGGLLREWV